MCYTIYIYGFVVKKILESIDCPECTAALYNNSDISISYVHTGAKSLLTCNKYGNLLLPSYSVYKVVTCVDNWLEDHSANGHLLISKTNLLLQCLYSKKPETLHFYLFKITPRRLISLIII